MTRELFRDDSYLQSCDAVVTAVDDNVLEVDQTVFYPLGGGQLGRCGDLALVQTHRDGQHVTQVRVADADTIQLPVAGDRFQRLFR